MISLEVLQSFVAVVDCGSVRAASRVCGYSAPAISRHLASLQHRWHLRLFERQGRNLRPSAEARLLLDDARQLIAEAQQFDAHAKLAGSTPSQSNSFATRDQEARLERID
jgi:DNA-binding transcriptional LysR family regulator